MDGFLFVPVHEAEVEAGSDLTDFVANVLCDQRGFGVVEDDAFLVVEPARGLIDFRDDCIDSEGGDPVRQCSMGCVEGLALPSEDVDEGGDLVAEGCAGSDDGSALGFAVWNVARGAGGEEIIQFLFGHGHKL